MKQKSVLMIGGTGTISTSVTQLALACGWDVTLLNRGNKPVPEGVHSLVADVHDEAAVARATAGMTFDVVAQFIAFTAADVARDIRMFQGKTKQYIFISSASAYQKPVRDFLITESTPLCNLYLQYSRDKIAAEDALTAAYRAQGFPMTIVRPSHTYDVTVPLGVHGAHGSWQVLRRMLEGKPVVIHGDGNSLWTMTHAKDFAKGFVGLMGNPHALGAAVHITSDESMTWNQIYATVADALGVPLHSVHVSSDFLAACGPQYNFGGALLGDKACSVVFDNSKIKRLVPGFVCTVSMADGLRRCALQMQETPALQVPDADFDIWCDRVIAAQEGAQSAFAKLQ